MTGAAGRTSAGLARRAVQFAAASAVVVLGSAWAITVLFAGPLVAQAVWTSAVLAFGVQLVTFAIAWPFLARNPLMGWGLGSLLRLLALVLYALVGVRSFGLAAAPALLSLAGFFFVSMLLESLFLKP